MNSRATLHAKIPDAPRWYDICAESELIEGIGVAARLGDTQIALFRVGSDVHVTGNFDPFSRANVIARGIVGDIGGCPVVASPVYKHHFRLEDGVCLEDENVRLPVWSARCIAGRIEVLVTTEGERP